MGKLVYRKRIELDTMDGMLRKVASAIKSHRDLRAYLADVPAEERNSFLWQIEPLLAFQMDRDLLEGDEPELPSMAEIDRSLAEGVTLTPGVDRLKALTEGSSAS